MEAERLLSRTFLEAHPADAALILERLPAEEAAAALEDLAPPAAGSVLQRMAVLAAAECLTRVSAHRVGGLVAGLPLPVAAGLLRRLEPDARERVLADAPAQASAALRTLLSYPEETAGALMDPRVLALPDDISAGEALTRVRRSPRHALYYLYVVDRTQILVGVLNLRELMLVRPKAPLASVMRRQVAQLSARADRATIVAHPGWREFHALPVVDSAGAFVGALRYETLRQLETDRPERDRAERAVAAVLSLGELCWVGLAGLLTDLAAITLERRPARGAGGHASSS